MKSQFLSIITITVAVMIIIIGYFSGATIDSGQAIGGVDDSNVQGIVGAVLLLMLVISIFFVVGNIRMMLIKNFHKKP